MSGKFTDDEVMHRARQIFMSSEEIINAYKDFTIAQLHEQLELETDFRTITFIQGQIAGIRDFCLVVKE